ncbi:hypothetical protein HHI36_013144 [Cryptolaemus montrouzieri]|uniref:Uncharacterized protein n=1 Tax=Cryptolaemus montrouzieri TaxID=559131 RepID=A0ABD2NHC1_9CUCU
MDQVRGLISNESPPENVQLNMVDELVDNKIRNCVLRENVHSLVELLQEVKGIEDNLREQETPTTRGDDISLPKLKNRPRHKFCRHSFEKHRFSTFNPRQNQDPY